MLWTNVARPIPTGNYIFSHDSLEGDSLQLHLGCQLVSVGIILLHYDANYLLEVHSRAGILKVEIHCGSTESGYDELCPLVRRKLVLLTTNLVFPGGVSDLLGSVPTEARIVEI